MGCGAATAPEPRLSPSKQAGHASGVQATAQGKSSFPNSPFHTHKRLCFGVVSLAAVYNTDYKAPSGLHTDCLPNNTPYAWPH